MCSTDFVNVRWRFESGGSCGLELEIWLTHLISAIGGKLPAIFLLIAQFSTPMCFFLLNLLCKHILQSLTHTHKDATFQVTPPMRHYNASLSTYLNSILLWGEQKETEKKIAHKYLICFGSEYIYTTCNVTALTHSCLHRKIQPETTCIMSFKCCLDCLHGWLVIFRVNKFAPL